MGLALGASRAGPKGRREPGRIDGLGYRRFRGLIDGLGRRRSGRCRGRCLGRLHHGRGLDGRGWHDRRGLSGRRNFSHGRGPLVGVVENRPGAGNPGPETGWNLRNHPQNPPVGLSGRVNVAVPKDWATESYRTSPSRSTVPHVLPIRLSALAGDSFTSGNVTV